MGTTDTTPKAVPGHCCCCGKDQKKTTTDLFGQTWCSECDSESQARPRVSSVPAPAPMFSAAESTRVADTLCAWFLNVLPIYRDEEAYKSNWKQTPVAFGRGIEWKLRGTIPHCVLTLDRGEIRLNPPIEQFTIWKAAPGHKSLTPVDKLEPTRAVLWRIIKNLRAPDAARCRELLRDPA